MQFFLRIAAAGCIWTAAADVLAAPVTVDFDGLNGNFEQPGQFYNGGQGSTGSGPGPDYGITFAPYGVTSSMPVATCNVPAACAAEGNSLRVFGSVLNGLEHGAIMQIEGGFRGILEFDASISNYGAAYIDVVSAFGVPPIASIYVKHPDPLDDCVRLECAFVHYAVNLADDPATPDDIVAHYLVIRTGAADAIFLDNIRFHDLILPEVVVPEPSTAVLVGSAGLLGAAWRRRRAARRD